MSNELHNLHERQGVFLLQEKGPMSEVTMSEYCDGYQFHDEAGSIIAVVPNEVGEHVNAMVKQIAELREQVAQEATFRNELKLLAMEWQDEDDYCACGHTELCGNQLLEFVTAHESTGDDQ
jgi:hypothetical protein